MIFNKVLNLFEGKKRSTFIWDVLLFYRRTFTSDEDIEIPSDKVLQMHSPVMDGELKVDGEAYIL